MIPLGKPVVNEEMKRAALGVLESGRFIKGEKNKEFEAEFAKFCGAKHAVAASSGTTALHAALLALGVKAGDEVIVPSATFIATANVVAYCGARPVFAEVDEKTYCLSPAAVKNKLTPRTKAIMPVHLYGHCADVDALREICDAHGAALVEDACQAHAAEYKGKRAGSLGRVAGFSFFPSKNMTVCGDGGMITTSDDEVAERARMIVDCGRKKKYEHEFIGFNYRLSELSAAIGVEQLKLLPEWTDARRRVASWYDEEFAPLEEKGVLALPKAAPYAKHVYHMYAPRVLAGEPQARAAKRDALIEFLAKRGVQAGIHYPIPVHLQPAYAFLGLKRGTKELAFTEAWADQVFSLPIFPALKREEVAQAAAAVREFFA